MSEPVPEAVAEALVELAQRLGVMETRVTALEALMAVQRGTQSAHYGDSEPVIVTPEPAKEA